MKVFDVIIIGAGPSGSTCALALANSGLQVAVIEKASFPRDKVCGDAVAAYVPKVLTSIHPKYGEAVNSFLEKTTVNTCRIIAPNEKFIDVRSNENGFISKRLHWDSFLYELTAAEPNITCFLQHEVTDVVIKDEKAIVTANNKLFTSKLVIACDGAHSNTSKKLTPNTTDLNHYSGAVRAYYTNVTGFSNNTYELHFLKELLPGYFWIFPMRNQQANVGVCIPTKFIKKRSMNLRHTMNEIIANHPVIKERFKNAQLTGKIEGYGLPLGSTKKVVSGAHFMICGDAASLIDPATGEGIGQSMISGRYAGWQALKCFEQQDFSAGFMKQYEIELYKKLWRNARISYRIQHLFFQHEQLFNTVFSLLSKTKFLKKYILKQVVKVADRK
ncbi:MAG: geranylgeranyl reductase family protein [Bacteroidota bacterium]